MNIKICEIAFLLLPRAALVRKWHFRNTFCSRIIEFIFNKTTIVFQRGSIGLSMCSYKHLFIYIGTRTLWGPDNGSAIHRVMLIM